MNHLLSQRNKIVPECQIKRSVPLSQFKYTNNLVSVFIGHFIAHTAHTTSMTYTEQAKLKLAVATAVSPEERSSHASTTF